MGATNGSMGMRRSRAMAAEHVTDGHPDKVCDQMADTIVTEALKQDSTSRVAMEVTGGHGKIWVTGEMTTKADLNIQQLLQQTYLDIGHNDNVEVWTNIRTTQSADIAKGVDETEGHEQGAGDQGIMTGYAVNETKELMPIEWALSQKLSLRLRQVRTLGLLPYLRPDGKSQVTMKNGQVTHVTIACHHAPGMDRETIEKDVTSMVIGEVIEDPKGVTIVVNGAGYFTIGGFEADAGTTGRKLVVDNYGPRMEIGGGCYSGKDPTKVDRSAAYACRQVAKSIVANGLAEEAVVKLAYAIGVAEPTHFSVQTNRSEEHDDKLTAMILSKLSFKPRAIIERLGLTDMTKDWTYRDTAAFGHYGRDIFPWEKVVDLS